MTIPEIPFVAGSRPATANGPTDAPILTSEQRAAWLQHWIGAHVAAGWQLEGRYGDNLAVMVGNPGRPARLHLMVDEAGGLTYGAGIPASQIMPVPPVRWFDNTYNQLAAALGAIAVIGLIVFVLAGVLR